MSGPAPQKPDSRVFASYPMPAKIDLVNENRRRQSQDQLRLGQQISGVSFNTRPLQPPPPPPPRIEITGHQSPVPNHEPTTSANINHMQQSVNNYHEQQVNNTTNTNVNNNNNYNYSASNQQQNQLYNQQPPPNYEQQVQQQQTYQQEMVQNQVNATADGQLRSTMTQQQQPQPQNTRTNTVLQATINHQIANKGAILAAELEEKEAKLMADITAFHQRPYSPYSTPDKISLSEEQRKAQRQFEEAPSPRPYSRASSNRSTSADLIDKEAKLLQEIDEMERKPFNPQTMVVEREQWFEYPQGRPNDRQLTESKRRVKDFCSLPSHMYPQQGAHYHEENLVGRPTSATGPPSSIHTTIIRSPNRVVDNKSPLPFAFDNFTTKGVRGNIASAGAIEPDRPRAPIYPIIKRSPSPNLARG